MRELVYLMRYSTYFSQTVNSSNLFILMLFLMFCVTAVITQTALIISLCPCLEITSLTSIYKASQSLRHQDVCKTA